MAVRRTVVAQVGMLVTLAALTGGALLLASCAPSLDPAPSPTTSAAAAPELPASAAPEPTVTLPTDCRNLVNVDAYDGFFGSTPLNDPGWLVDRPAGVIQPSEAPAGAPPSDVLDAAIRLSCEWRDPGADITGLFASVAVADPAVVSAYMDELAATGYTCEDALGGRRCQYITTESQYGTDWGRTSFARDDLHIRIEQFNFPTSNLVGAIVDRLWPE